MRHDKQTKLSAKAKQDKSIFILRVIGIVLQPGVLVGKRCGCFFKGNTMLTLISSILPIIP